MTKRDFSEENSHKRSIGLTNRFPTKYFFCTRLCCVVLAFGAQSAVEKRFGKLDLLFFWFAFSLLSRGEIFMIELLRTLRFFLAFLM